MTANATTLAQALRSIGAVRIHKARTLRLEVLTFDLDADTFIDAGIPAIQALPFATAVTDSDIDAGRFSIQVG